jgi:hypothetical protein
MPHSMIVFGLCLPPCVPAASTHPEAVSSNRATGPVLICSQERRSKKEPRRGLGIARAPTAVALCECGGIGASGPARKLLHFARFVESAATLRRKRKRAPAVMQNQGSDQQSPSLFVR